MNRRTVPWRGAAVAVGIVAALTGCSIGVDEAPRDIALSEVADTLPSDVNTGAEATGSGRIYLLAPEMEGVPSRLQAVARDVADDPTAVMAALLAGPNSREFVEQLRTALPTDLELNSARLRSGGVLEIDVSRALIELPSELLISGVAQIVYTASTISGVRSVLITVDGVATEWPAGNGELRIAPLTVYDYPGLEPSSQPPYPGVPPRDGAA